MNLEVHLLNPPSYFNNSRDFVDYVAAFAPVLIATLAVYFACLQWKTYEKQYKIQIASHKIQIADRVLINFKKFREVQAELIENDVSVTALYKMNLVLDEAKIVLPGEIVQYLEGTYKYLQEAVTLRGQMEAIDITGDDKIANGQKYVDLYNQKEKIRFAIFQEEPHTLYRKYYVEEFQ